MIHITSHIGFSSFCFNAKRKEHEESFVIISSHQKFGNNTTTTINMRVFIPITILSYYNNYQQFLFLEYA
jgi:hypothetical protein